MSMVYGEEKTAGHYCRICGRRRANEKFGGRGHALHICKDCQRELKREARQKRKAGEKDAVLPETGENFMDMDEADLEWLPDEPPITPSTKGTGKKGIPYDELDANIVRLVQALNRYPGVMTVGSCGGHETIIGKVTGKWHGQLTRATKPETPILRFFQK